MACTLSHLAQRTRQLAQLQRLCPRRQPRNIGLASLQAPSPRLLLQFASCARIASAFRGLCCRCWLIIGSHGLEGQKLQIRSLRHTSLAWRWLLRPLCPCWRQGMHSPWHHVAAATAAMSGTPCSRRLIEMGCPPEPMSADGTRALTAGGSLAARAAVLLQLHLQEKPTGPYRSLKPVY